MIDDEEDESPRGTKRAIVGMVFWLLGCICVIAVFWFLIYKLYFSLHWRHHHR